jgi:RHS repeat-associated protein
VLASPLRSWLLLGNRLSLGAAPNGISYSWDAVNRLASYQNGAGTATTYQYRADGMRVSKMVPPGVTTRYRYDGQMGIEDVDSSGNVKQYGLGARGIESITNPSAGVMYPIFDAHGNMTGTICPSGTNSFTLANQRSYDAWGLVRSGSGSGDPTGRYCAALGHKQDDESGLIYMRARYYEPGSGRFISEDPGGQGNNWFSYCGNRPTCADDATGRRWQFTLGDYTFCIDWDNDAGAMSDLHVWENGKEILSIFGWGFGKHPDAANKWTKDLIKTVFRNAMSGNRDAIKLANLLTEGWFGFDSEALAEAVKASGGGKGMAVIAYTTIDAAFEQDPVFVWGLFQDIFGGGR